MHMPDGVIDPPMLIVSGAATVGALVWSARSLRAGRKRIGLALAGGAAVMVAHLVDVPLVGVHTGHLIGGTLLALALGPSLALMTMVAVLGLEALVLGDGGVAALGVNSLVMAVVGVLAGWAVYRGVLDAVEHRLPDGRSPGDAWRVGAAALGAFASVLGSSIALMGVLAVGAPAALDGTSLHVLVPHHLAWAGLEAAITGVVVATALVWRRSRARALARSLVGRHVRVLDGDMDTLG